MDGTLPASAPSRMGGVSFAIHHAIAGETFPGSRREIFMSQSVRSASARTSGGPASMLFNSFRASGDGRALK